MRRLATEYGLLTTDFFYIRGPPFMLVKLKQHFIGFSAGKVIDVSDADAKTLIEKGILHHRRDQARGRAEIDWTIKEYVRAKLRSAVKRVLPKYEYPPDKQESATDLVLQQAELLCAELAPGRGAYFLSQAFRPFRNNLS
jgi:hypothetical protein